MNLEGEVTVPSSVVEKQEIFLGVTSHLFPYFVRRKKQVVKSAVFFTMATLSVEKA